MVGEALDYLHVGAEEPLWRTTPQVSVRATTIAGGVCAGIVHVEQPGDGLLLRQFPRLALVDASPAGELRRRGRPALREGAVRPEPVAEVDVDQVDRTEYGPTRRPTGASLRWAAL